MNDERIIRAQRIGLRPTTEADVPDLVALWNDPRVMAVLGYPRGVGYTEATAREWLRDTVELNPARRHYVAEAEGVGFCGELHYTVNRWALNGRR
jgi:RimJ/RimL family protein N-acetyltransferase